MSYLDLENKVCVVDDEEGDFCIFDFHSRCLECFLSNEKLVIQTPDDQADPWNSTELSKKEVGDLIEALTTLYTRM